jgi:methylenetetrahydrofolate dehydrogenase (NADP+)/methenyltetrahydrofolate cyclohydrolase
LIQAIAESIRFTESYENKSVVILARSDEFAQNMQDYLSESLSLNNISIKKEFKEDISDFDIIISLIGIPGLITKDHIKQDAICIDVGITMVKGKPRGDFHSNINEKASFKTPVPKGVGPMTIAYLMKNILS